MPTYALVQNGIVAELFTPPDGFTIDQCFTPEVVAQAADVTTADPAPAPGWTATETAGVWSFTAPPPPPPPTLAQQAQAALGLGLAISSTGTPSLNGTYAVDTATQEDITAQLLEVLATGKFLGGASTLAWSQANGTAVSFPSMTEFQAFAAAVAGYAATLEQITQTGAGPLPAASASIP